MIAEELINQMIPSLIPEDSAEKALYWMEELQIPALPVTDNNRYTGLLQKTEIATLPDIAGSVVSDFSLSHTEVFTLPQQPFYDILKIAEENRTEIVAVVNDNQVYAGVITIADTLVSYTQNYAHQESGGTLVLSMSERDYSLSEISRLVESNDAKIISSFVSAGTHDADNIRLTLKINKFDLTRIIATFERFEYRIIAKYQQSETSQVDKERYDLLMKYLNI
jgi:CBS domain-containing protein